MSRFNPTFEKAIAFIVEACAGLLESSNCHWWQDRAVAMALVFAFLPALVDATESKRLEPLVVRFIEPKVSPDDGYWQWLPIYLSKQKEQRQRVTEIRHELGLLARDVRLLREKWLRLLHRDNRTIPSVQYGSGWDNYFGVGSASELGSQISRTWIEAEVSHAFDYWTSGWLGAPIELVEPSVLGAHAIESYENRRKVVRTEINTIKQNQQVLIEKGLEVTDALRESIEKQAEKSGERRPWLISSARVLAQQEPLLRLELYDSAEWYMASEVPRLVESISTAIPLSEDKARLINAKRQLALATRTEEKLKLQRISPAQQPPDGRLIAQSRSERLQAIVELRRALDLNPENMAVRQLLQQQELHWLRRIAQRIDEDQQVSFGAFREYLAARWIPTEDPGSIWDGVYDYGIAAWGMGPIALWAGVEGLPIAKAEAVGAQQLQAARDQVSLMVINRLVKNGTRLTDLSGLSREQFGKIISLQRAGGGELDDSRVTRLFIEMKQTLNGITALQRLANSDPTNFAEQVSKAFGPRFYAPIDSSYSKSEWFGDLFNVKNIIFLWGPNMLLNAGGSDAATRMSGRLVGAAEIEVATDAGNIMFGIDAFVQTMRIDRVAQAFSSTAAGQRIASAWRAREAQRAAGGLVSTAADIGVDLSAAMLLFGGLGVAAETYNVPGGMLLVEVLSEVAGSRYLYDAFSGGALSVARLSFKVDDVGRFVASAETRLARQRQVTRQIGEIADQLSDSATDGSTRLALERTVRELSPGNTQVAAGATRPATPSTTGTVTSGGTRLVNGGTIEQLPQSATAAIDQANTLAVRAAAVGDPREATRAIRAAENLADEVNDTLQTANHNLSGARRALAEAAEPPKRRLDFNSIGTEEDLKMAPFKFRNKQLYRGGNPEIGALLKAGDDALQLNNFEVAAHNFRLAAAKAKVSPNMVSHVDHIAYAQRQLFVATKAKNWQEVRAAWRAVNAAPATDLATLADDEIAMVLDMVAKGQARSVQDAEAVITRAGQSLEIHSVNSVRQVTDVDGNRYIVKQLSQGARDRVANRPEINLDDVFPMEAACTRLAVLVGVPTSPARYLPEQGLLIVRPVKNAVQLQNMPEHVAVALKKEMARARVLRAWLGDMDGHTANQLVDESGRLIQIDFDLATFTNYSTHIGNHSGWSGPNETLQDVTSMLHGFFPTPGTGQTASGHAPYAWIARIDQMSSYDDVADVVDNIVKLSQSDELLKVIRASGYSKPEEAAQILKGRARVLEQELRNYFGKWRPSQASIMNRSSMKLAA